MHTLIALQACSASPPVIEGPVVLTGATVVGVGQRDIRIEDGAITAVTTSEATERADATIVEHTGRFVTPAFVDAHVHLAFLSRAAEMGDGGVAAVVDWASPLAWLDTPPQPLQLVASGPMITAEAGYPTQTWGSGGYGAECTDGPSCIASSTRHAPRARAW